MYPSIGVRNLRNASFVYPMESHWHNCDVPSHFAYDREVFDRRDETILLEIYAGI